MIFLNSASSAAALVFYLPGVCTHTDTPRENRERPESEIFKIFGKNTIFNEQPVCFQAIISILQSVYIPIIPSFYLIYFFFRLIVEDLP